MCLRVTLGGHRWAWSGTCATYRETARPWGGTRLGDTWREILPTAALERTTTVLIASGKLKYHWKLCSVERVFCSRQERKVQQRSSLVIGPDGVVRVLLSGRAGPIARVPWDLARTSTANVLSPHNGSLGNCHNGFLGYCNGFHYSYTYITFWAGGDRDPVCGQDN